jgi:hypothetical protein
MQKQLQSGNEARERRAEILKGAGGRDGRRKGKRRVGLMVGMRLKPRLTRTKRRRMGWMMMRSQVRVLGRDLQVGKRGRVKRPGERMHHSSRGNGTISLRMLFLGGVLYKVFYLDFVNCI